MTDLWRSKNNNNVDRTISHTCYLCLWDSRIRNDYYKDVRWSIRWSFKLGSQHIINNSQVDPSKAVISPLHIKLGLMSH